MSESSRTMICPECGAENYSWRSRCQTCNVLLHDDSGIKLTDDPYGERMLRWCALITGLLGTVTFVIDSLFYTALAGSLLLTIPIGLFILGSVLIARKWPFIGGTLLIVEGFVPLVFLVIFIISQGFSGFLLLLHGLAALPLLVSGSLFFFLWREGQRQANGG